MGGCHRHKVMVKITDYGNGKDKNPEGRVTEILGAHQRSGRGHPFHYPGL